MPPPQDARAPSPDGFFHTTRWSIVLAARGEPSTEADAALAELCRNYYAPLHRFVRRAVANPHDAEDLVQAFFEQLLRGRMVAEADASRGRFRSFLLARLQQFLIDEWRKGQRQKRGSGAAPVSLDDFESGDAVWGKLARDDDPARRFDREWAATLLDRAIARLAVECDGGGKAGRFAVVKGFLTGDRGELPLVQAAHALDLSLPAVKSMVHRLRQRYRSIVREEVAATLAEGEDIEAELRWVVAAVRPE